MTVHGDFEGNSGEVLFRFEISFIGKASINALSGDYTENKADLDPLKNYPKYLDTQILDLHWKQPRHNTKV